MVSISANTFRVYAQKGQKYILMYYPGQVFIPESGRTFEVSLLWSKSDLSMRLMATEQFEQEQPGRPPRKKWRNLCQKERLALYHAIRKWEEKNRFY